MKPTNKVYLRSKIVAIAAASLAFAATGCGKQAYVVTSANQEQQAPGHFTVPPKVDILMAEDDTGSMFEAYPTISKQVPTFLTGLESKGWDYHFATIPLTTDKSVNQILASRHDGNWGSLWVEPYPGAILGGPGTIVSNLFSTPSSYTGFIKNSDISNSLNGMEPGLETIRKALVSRLVGTNFLRDDAMLVILVVGNGNDTSGVLFCTRSDGYTAPCESIGEAGTSEWSFNYYKSQFLKLKSNQAQLKFFSAVSAKNANSCLGGRAYVGTRYMQMASQLGGSSYDICSMPISQALEGVSTNLQATKIAFRTRYLFIAHAPDLASVVVTRYPAGGGQPTVIPMDDQNGWTYAGYVNNVYSIDSPIPMSLASGHAIELHGSAKLVGDDKATVSFKPAGAQDSVK